MKKLTRNEVNLIWGSHFNDRELYVAKSYIVNDTLRHCARYQGEGLDEALCNSTYDDCVDLLDTIQMSDDMYKSDFISSIHCEINDMIERYNKKQQVSLAHRIARAGLTQTEFAKKIGVSRQQVNNWTSGRCNMSLVYKLKADDILK